MQPRSGCPVSTGRRYVDWRARCLCAAGFEPATARRAAHDPAFDLHALLELVDAGCSPGLAVRILAPLDELDGELSPEPAP